MARPGCTCAILVTPAGSRKSRSFFDENVDVYFARAQVNERLARGRKPTRRGRATNQAISTGLGEIYMWTVEYENQSRFYSTRPKSRSSDLKRRCICAPFRTGSSARSLKPFPALPRLMPSWWLRPAIPLLQPDPQKLASLGLTFTDVIEALERNNTSTGGFSGAER